MRGGRRTRVVPAARIPPAWRRQDILGFVSKTPRHCPEENSPSYSSLHPTPAPQQHAQTAKGQHADGRRLRHPRDQDVVNVGIRGAAKVVDNGARIGDLVEAAAAVMWAATSWRSSVPACLFKRLPEDAVGRLEHTLVSASESRDLSSSCLCAPPVVGASWRSSCL